MLYVKNAPSRAVKPVKLISKKTLLKPQMQLRIFIQIEEYNFETDKFGKIKQKFLFQPNIPCVFEV